MKSEVVISHALTRSLISRIRIFRENVKDTFHLFYIFFSLSSTLLFLNVLVSRNHNT